MPRSARRVLYTQERVGALFARMRQELEDMDARHRAELQRLYAELAKVRAEHEELRSLAIARSKLDGEIAELHRLRDIGRAKLAQRDPATPLN
jgi:hypothetical protein